MSGQIASVQNSGQNFDSEDSSVPHPRNAGAVGDASSSVREGLAKAVPWVVLGVGVFSLGWGTYDAVVKRKGFAPVRTWFGLGLLIGGGSVAWLQPKLRA